MLNVQAGWPVDRSQGDWIGWNDKGRISILRWIEDTPDGVPPTWIGVCLDPGEPKQKHWPLAFRRGQGTNDFVTQHCAADELRRLAVSDFPTVEFPDLRCFTRGIRGQG